MSRFVAIASILAIFSAWLPHSHLEGHAVEGHADGRATAHAAIVGEARAVAHSPATGARDLRSALGSVECAHDSMASDDAHEEHSSHASIDGGPCLSCRSKEDREVDRVRSADPAFQVARSTEHRIAAPGCLPRDLALGLHPPRAPPIG